MVLVGMQPVLTHVPPNNFRSMIATFMPDCRQPSSKKWPRLPSADHDRVELRVHAIATDPDRAPDGDHVFKKRNRKILAPGRPHQPRPEFIAAQCSRQRAQRAGDQAAHSYPPVSAAPQNAPETIRNQNGPGALRLGVFGSLSATNSPIAITVRM